MADNLDDYLREGDEVYAKDDDGHWGIETVAGVEATDDPHSDRIRVKLEGVSRARLLRKSNVPDRLVTRTEDDRSAVRDLRAKESMLLSRVVEMKQTDLGQVCERSWMQSYRELVRSLASVQQGLEARGARTAELTYKELHESI